MVTLESAIDKTATLPVRPATVHHPNAMLRWMASVWDHVWTRVATAGAIAAITGVIIALIMPRGPVTTREALLLMTTGFVVGLVAGFLMRSRWAMLIAPLAHISAFEIIRLSEVGPTVDGIHLGTTFGILAFLVGRGVYGIVGLLPMVLGVVYGAALARWTLCRLEHRRSHHRTFGSYARGGMGALSTAGMIALVVWIAIPASVAPITGPDGNPVPGSISELTSVSIGGNEQWLEMRGASEDLPILLYLSGGPGQSDLAFSRAIFEDLTRDFIVVGWDQRGNGKSYADWDGASMTLDRAVADTIEVTNYLRERFDEEKIYVLGESWGTTLGVLAVQQHPELYHAFIGSGQMVSQLETDRIIYQDLIAYAEEAGDGDLLNTLESFGPPPYGDLWAYGVVMENYPKIEGEYDPPQAYIDRGESAGVGFWGMMGSEYTAIDKVNLFRGLLDTFALLYPQLQEIDFRRDVPTLEVPVYLLDGEHELRGRRDLAHEWFAMLDAPEKEMFTFENAGHSVAFEHYEELHRILVDIVLPATYLASDA